MAGDGERALWTDRVFETLVENAPDIIARFGRDLRPRYVNAAIERLTGIPAGHFVGRTFEEAGFPPAAAAEWNALAQQAFRAGEQIETEFTHAIGNDLRWFRSKAVPEVGPDGSVDTIIVVCRDITEIKASMEARIDRAESERNALLENEKLLRVAAEEASQAKDALLAAVSHEMLNPLTSLMGWLNILEGGADPTLTALALRSMRASLATQKRMVDDLLDMVRFSRGKILLTITNVDVTGLIDEIVDTFRPVAAAAGIELRAGEVEDVVIPGDRARLGQVVTNLLSNALKFTPGGGVVRIAARMEASDLVIEVTDTGCGIAPELLARVFDKFVQAGTTSRQGLGLGLAIVKEIVESHGGTVAAHSEGPGTGSRFTVRLPG